MEKRFVVHQNQTIFEFLCTKSTEESVQNENCKNAPGPVESCRTLVRFILLDKS